MEEKALTNYVGAVFFVSFFPLLFTFIIGATAAWLVSRKFGLQKLQSNIKGRHVLI